MKIFRFIFFLLVLCFAFNELDAQDLKENEIVVIKGEKFVLHQVRTGETIYSISRDFKVDRSLLLQHNPKISEGLDIGEIVKIPFQGYLETNQNQIIQKGDPTGFQFHTIESRKETPYFIAQKYKVTVEELYAYNPEVNKFKKGMQIRIPVWEIVKKPVSVESTLIVQAEEKDNGKGNGMQMHTVISGETLYSISKKYRVSESEILFLNPTAKSLKAGSNLYIPQTNTENNELAEELNLENRNYFEHTIESGETLWGTTQKYKVSEEELQELNPAIKTGFRAGVLIKIPVKTEIETAQAKPVNDDAFLKHEVQKGESLYGIAGQYNLTIPVIQKYNPVLENRNLVEGETILIPQQVGSEKITFEAKNEADSIQQIEDYYRVELPVEIPESCMTDEKMLFSNKQYNIALFLPLYLEANDTLNRVTENLELTDSLTQQIAVEVEKEETMELFQQFYGGSENYLQFYEGVLLAIDSMQKTGLRVKLNVFDSQNNTDFIRKYIFTNEFLETDLIIGPILPEVQKEVAQIAAKNRIPFVSPMAWQTDICKSNPYYYQVIPSREYIIDKTAEMVAEEYFNSNLIVVKTGNYERTEEGKMVELIQEKMFNTGFLSKRDGGSFAIYDFSVEGPSGLRSIMSTDKENVVFIPSMNEGELSVAISNVNNLTDDYSITLIGSNRYQRNESINIEQYHNMKMKYIAPYWMDFNNTNTIHFIKKFKKNFGTEPNNYGTQGYDVAFYFLNALKKYGNNFEDCLPYLHVNLVQGNYHFEKISQFGGYMNQGVSIISYSRDYEVSRERVKGQPQLITEY